MTDAAFAIDQGTTATKALRLTGDGSATVGEGVRHRQIYPHSGWVEHDPEELLASVRTCLAGCRPGDRVGLANQGETIVAWDAETGAPVYNAIVWQDRRTAGVIDDLKAAGHEQAVLDRAGLPLDPYFSAAKMRWILDNVAAAQDLLAQNRLRIATSDAFFLDRLCGVYATDVTTASRTSLMNLGSLDWDPELCALFGVPMDALPPIRPTCTDFGTLKVAGGEAVVTASVVDQQAALFGHGCRAAGDAKITFGTGAFVLAVSGDRATSDPDSGILPTVAWQLAGEPAHYALDGGVFNAASAVDWAQRLGLFQSYDEIDAFDAAPAIERDLVFVPALSGLGCPHWDGSAAGLWLGMSLETTAQDLCQAVLEGVALRTAEVIRAMAGITPLAEPLSIDGGLSQNSYFQQFLADATGRTVRPRGEAEVTARGAALLAFDAASRPAETEDTGAVVAPRAVGLDYSTRFAEAVRRAEGWRS